jgi:membrane associated rhomboid family serine protease
MTAIVRQEQYNPESDPDGATTPAVRWLIALNVGVYFLQVTVFGAPNVSALMALSTAKFPAEWWTVATYMFVHAGAAHLLTNMIMLWMFGPKLEHSIGTRSFVNFYLWCGLGGGIFHLLLVPQGAVVGASGAVVGVVFAYAMRWPEQEVYLLGMIPMKARWLAVWTIVLNVGFALADTFGATHGSTAWMAHVGGLAFAWLYLHRPNTAGLEQIRRHVETVPELPDKAKPVPKSHRPKRREEPAQTADEAVARSNAVVKRRPAPAIRPVMSEKPEDVNALLDKISRYGLESLTDAERQLLDEVSRRLRGN